MNKAIKVFGPMLCFVVAACAACGPEDAPPRGQGGSAPAEVCAPYCGQNPEADVVGRCKVAFGDGYAKVQQCNRSSPPRGCKAMDDFSPDFSAPCPDGTDYPIFCCE